MTKLIAENLEKSYKKRIIVKDVSLEVNSGEIVGLLGPNGAGKTTTFYMIAGIIKLDSGRILLDKKDISILPLHYRARLGIGYLPQEVSIFRRLSVFENLIAVLEINKKLTHAQRKNKANDLMEEFHVTHIRNNFGYSLSGGERRRVEIARVLAISPKFVLLDEPFSGVDPISVIDIKNIMIHLRKKNIGILITDHNVREILDICERAYIVSYGELIACGTSKEVLNNEQVKKVYLGNKFFL